MTNLHLINSRAILEALIANSRRNWPSPPAYLGSDGLTSCQRYIYDRFSDIINTPSFQYISKTSQGWLIVGDNRAEVSARISLVIERHGIGVGMMILHGQQMRSRHVLTEIEENGVSHSLLKPTEMLCGVNNERVLYAPIRRFRGDTTKLAELSIVKPKEFWDQSRLVAHERDRSPFCFYCSASEINPAEVMVDISGTRLGLSRDYTLGFTFAPFGNPLSVMHFLAWDHASHPLDMSRAPMTVSDLVHMTRLINISIRDYFEGTGCAPLPLLDGFSNGWAGNSIYHQHFQFFQPEYEGPLADPAGLGKDLLVERDDIRISRLYWPTPIYQIAADHAINVGLVGNDLAGIWRFLGIKGEKRRAHTQNIYIRGRDLGRSAFIIPRDRNKVNFEPSKTDFVDRQREKTPQAKMNIGVLEASGTLIVDDYASFQEMARWQPQDISEQLRQITNAIAPSTIDVREFENTIVSLFAPDQQ